MYNETKARWHELCEQAFIEQDPHEFIELVDEIDQVLQKKQTRLNSLQSKPTNLLFIDREGFKARRAPSL